MQRFFTEAQQQQLKSRLNSKPSGTMTFAQARDRVFAAIEVEDAASLEAVVEGWWRKTVAPALNDGSRVLENADMYPFMEMAHALRDNLQIDMRDDIRPVFRDLALRRLLNYYPASYPARRMTIASLRITARATLISNFPHSPGLGVRAGGV